VLDPKTLSWTDAKRVRSLLSSHQLYSKVAARRSKSGQDVSAQFQALDTGQQALVNNLVKEKNVAEKEPDTEWKLFGVSKLFADRKTASKTLRVNTAIRVTLRRGYKAEDNLGSDHGEGSAKKTVSSESMINSAGSAARSEKPFDSKSKKNYAATKPPAAQPISSPYDKIRDAYAPTLFPSDLIVERKRSGDLFYNILEMSNTPPPLRPSATSASLHRQHEDDDIVGGEFISSTLDWGSLEGWDSEAQHEISRLQEIVPGIQNGSQDVKHKPNVHERRKIMKAFLDRERGYKAMKHPGGQNIGKPNPRQKLRPSVNDLSVPVQDASISEQTTSAEEKRPESVEVTLRDADTEVSGSHHWKISSAGKARVTEAKDTSRARTSPHNDDHEASLSGKPRSTEIGTTPKDEPPVHDDISHLGIPVVKSSWSLEHGADLSGDSQLSMNIARFLVSTNDLEPILIVSLLGIGIHDTSEKQLNVCWYVVLGVVSVLLAAIVYLAYIHLGLETSGNSGGAVEGHDEKEIQMPDGSDWRDFLYNSEAYNTSGTELFNVAHELYEKRIRSAIGGDLEQAGVRLEKDVTRYTGREISWVPVHYLTFSDDASLSYADTMKAVIEERMGESWNWWPLAPRLHQLRPGYCRLQWKSVCGSSSFFSSDTIQLTAHKSHAEPFATSIFRRASRTLCNKLSKLRLPSSTLTLPLANVYTRRAGIVSVKRAPEVSPRPCHILAQGLPQQARHFWNGLRNLSRPANRRLLQARGPIQRHKMCKLSTSINTCHFASCLPLATLST
jgi:hypothetical protein